MLMELKTPGGLPMWMVRFLSEHQIRKISYSKYGTAYTRLAAGEAKQACGGLADAASSLSMIMPQARRSKGQRRKVPRL